MTVSEKEWTLEISGMTCDHCARTIDETLRRVPGVVESATHFEEGRARVVAEGVEGAALAGAIAAKGYKVVRRTSRLLEAQRSGGEEIAGGGRGGVK